MAASKKKNKKSAAKKRRKQLAESGVKNSAQNNAKGGEKNGAESSVKAAAQPPVEPVPEPVAEPAPEPVVEPAPEPVAEPAPETAVEPAPEPAVEPAVEPTPEPVAEPAPEPAVEPAPEPAAKKSADDSRKKRMKKPFVLRLLRSVAAVLLLLVVSYVAYVFIAYHRLPDNQVLEVYGKADEQSAKLAAIGTPYRIVSWNVGFGAYEDDYGFFMDGGTQSWAWSEERLEANLKKIGTLLVEQDADLCLIQEIDTDSTRTYHTNEYKILEGFLMQARVYDRAFAQNYDSPFLLYPFTQPHGASKAGIATFADFTVTSALRRSLPIEKGFTKLLDLDRCYSVSRIPVRTGFELVLYNFHLSAYTSDGTIATEQLRMLLEDMQGEYEKGNYCIAGGDFNKDLLGDSSVWFGAGDKEYTWAKPIPTETFDGIDIRLIAPLDEANPVPSCRNADGPYHEGQYVLTIDGFLVSPNVTVGEAKVIDTGFRYSDHNPVSMRFSLHGQ